MQTSGDDNSLQERSGASGREQQGDQVTEGRQCVGVGNGLCVNTDMVFPLTTPAPPGVPNTPTTLR